VKNYDKSYPLCLFQGAIKLVPIVHSVYIIFIQTTLSFIGSVLMIYKIVVVKGMNGRVVHLKTLSLPVNPQM